MPILEEKADNYCGGTKRVICDSQDFEIYGLFEMRSNLTRLYTAS
jgi:hypothetical protein